jgi:hypothetical protein
MAAATALTTLRSDFRRPKTRTWNSASELDACAGRFSLLNVFLCFCS